jgi:hypothetical protein
MAAGVFSLVLAGADCPASSARFTLPELIDRSEVIALGTVVGFERAPDPYGSGEVRVGLIGIDRLLKGPAGLDWVRLLLPPPGGPAAGAAVEHGAGETGLWFLRLVDCSARVFAADHPQRFAPADMAERLVGEVEAALLP